MLVVTDSNATRSPDRPGHRSSRYWLHAAFVATVVGLVLMGIDLAGLLQLPPEARLSDAPPVDTTGSLIVAVARTPGGPDEWANWGQVIKYISDELGQPITVRYLSHEDEATEVVLGEDIDIAFLCAHQYVDLLDQDAVVGVATPIIRGSSLTQHLLVVRADDPIQDFAALEGSTFAISDKSSLGGFAYLAYLTAQLEMKPAEFCGELTLGESQEQNMRAVLQGAVRATVVNTAQIGSWDMSRFRVLERSESIGCPPVVADAQLEPEVRDRIREILVSCDTEALLGTASAIDGFKVLDPLEYDFVYVLRDACGHHIH
jgi:ABC-type phosphate/phosphonate transport system substrate-binding protein